jgi:hypothetical protein
VVVVFQMQGEAVSQTVGVNVAADEEMGVDEEAVELVQLLASPTATATATVMPIARMPKRVMPAP